jgi:hypothetical protein
MLISSSFLHSHAAHNRSITLQPTFTSGRSNAVVSITITILLEDMKKEWMGWCTGEDWESGCISQIVSLEWLERRPETQNYEILHCSSISSFIFYHYALLPTTTTAPIYFLHSRQTEQCISKNLTFSTHNNLMFSLWINLVRKWHRSANAFHFIVSLS